MPKHKHAELIKAWADGAEIEFLDALDDKWRIVDNPRWCFNIQYRIKPVKKSAGQVLKESNPSSLSQVHWDNLDWSTKNYYEEHANRFLEAWKKENE